MNYAVKKIKKEIIKEEKGITEAFKKEKIVPYSRSKGPAHGGYDGKQTHGFALKEARAAEKRLEEKKKERRGQSFANW